MDLTVLSTNEPHLTPVDNINESFYEIWRSAGFSCQNPKQNKIILDAVKMYKLKKKKKSAFENEVHFVFEKVHLK